jgi:tetratricopeptide (TPR) repeat protein
MLATFGMRQPREMYSRFLEAHDRATALGVLTAELRCNHAHGLHIFERRFAEAECEFVATLEENPGLASAYVRLARMYASCGRTDEALEVLARGDRADPLLPTVPAMTMLIRFWRREFDVAIALGKETIELHPYVQVVRATYGQALEFSGRLDEALAQYQAALAISPDLTWLRALEGTCLARQRRDADALAILEELEQLRQSEYVDASFMAVFRVALGQRDEAFIELERARDENSAWLHALDVDPTMDGFRNDPRFARLRDEVFRHAMPPEPRPR